MACREQASIRAQRRQPRSLFRVIDHQWVLFAAQSPIPHIA